MKKFETIELKSVNGNHIVKSWEVHSITGKRKPGSALYEVYTPDNEGLVGVYKTLKEAQNACK